MGDIRKFRRSIVHNSNKSIYPISSYAVFTWFDKNEEIYIDSDKFYEMVQKVIEFFSGLTQEELKKYFIKNVNTEWVGVGHARPTRFSAVLRAVQIS